MTESTPKWLDVIAAASEKMLQELEKERYPDLVTCVVAFLIHPNDDDDEFFFLVHPCNIQVFSFHFIRHDVPIRPQ